MLVVKLCIIDEWDGMGCHGTAAAAGRECVSYLETPDCFFQLVLGAQSTRFQVRLGQIIKLHEVIVLQGEMDRYIREVCQRNGWYLNNGPVCHMASSVSQTICRFANDAACQHQQKKKTKEKIPIVSMGRKRTRTKTFCIKLMIKATPDRAATTTEHKQQQKL